MSHSLPFDAVKIASRSMGVKLIVVCFLALAMVIPALFVWALIDDRSQRAEQVTREVSGTLGGPQTFLGPILAIPYTIPATEKKQATHSVYIVFPTTAEATVSTAAEARHRSLFKVPVYRSDLAFNGRFDLAGVPANAPEGALLDWSRAEFLLGATEPRGAQSDIVLTAGGGHYTLAPGSVLPVATVRNDNGPEVQMNFFGAPTGGLAQPGARFDYSARLRFTGAQRLAVLANGKTTTLLVKGDWAHPSFDGSFLPGSQKLTDSGFEASWSVPFIARGVAAEGSSDIVGRLGRTAMGVSFVEVADPYQSVTRALKYSLLFIGLVFLSYFLFEVTSGKRVHPAQYLLVGVAQIIFYLLLLSVAERVGFDWAFLIAATATVGLISAYASWVFAAKKYGWRALAAFSTLYAFIYVLLRLEDQALLVGALASFAAIAAVMYFTRHMDWYGTSAGVPAAGTQT